MLYFILLDGGEIGRTWVWEGDVICFLPRVDSLPSSYNHSHSLTGQAGSSHEPTVRRDPGLEARGKYIVSAWTEVEDHSELPLLSLGSTGE